MYMYLFNKLPTSTFGTKRREADLCSGVPDCQRRRAKTPRPMMIVPMTNAPSSLMGMT
jgi:hypothetical protein